MEQWEYVALHVTINPTFVVMTLAGTDGTVTTLPTHEVGLGAVSALINTLAKERWELVTADTVSMGPGFLASTYWLRRSTLS